MSEERYKILKELLESEACFKMICGAGNEDKEYVKKLALVYTLAGAKILDVSCNVKVIEHAMQGIDLAYDLSKELVMVENEFIEKRKEIVKIKMESNIKIKLSDRGIAPSLNPPTKIVVTKE